MILGKSYKKRKIGLALGSGAARGFASMGVLKALKEMGIFPDLVAGTSMGALVGAFEATGNLETLEEVIIETDWKKIIRFFTDIVFPRDGLIDGKRVESFIQKYTQDMLIEETDIPFRAVSTDILTGEEVIISEGKLIEAVRASISIPGIFTPVRRDGRFLVDGALVNPVPVTVARDMGATVVIAVDVNRFLFEERNDMKDRGKKAKVGRQRRRKGRVKLPGGKTLHLERVTSALGKRFEKVDLQVFDQIKKLRSRQKGPNIFEIMLASGHIMGYHISRYMLDLYEPEIIVTPRVGHIKLLDFHRGKEAVSIGYEAAMEQRDEIEKVIKRKRKHKRQA